MERYTQVYPRMTQFCIHLVNRRTKCWEATTSLACVSKRFVTCAVVTYLCLIASTLAGSTSNGFADGVGQSAKFNAPEGVVYHPKDGYCYVADSSNHRIRKVSPKGVFLGCYGLLNQNKGEVTTFAGSGTVGWQDGTAALAQFKYPRRVVVHEASGDLFVADNLNHRICKISTEGMNSNFTRCYVCCRYCDHSCRKPKIRKRWWPHLKCII